MIYLQLLFVFFKTGLFGLGGGYAMIPLLEREFTAHGWLGPGEFIDMIAIAEMTPGPIIVNLATFVGYKTAGFFGGLVATIGVALPSLILILVISSFFFRFKDHPLGAAILSWLRPIIMGLIVAAALVISETAIFKGKLSLGLLAQVFIRPLDVVNIGSVFIFALSFFALKRFKLHPILVILIFGACGIFFFYLG